MARHTHPRGIASLRTPFLIALAIGAAAAPSGALAAVDNPPVMPMDVTVFPERDFAVVDGWFADQPFQMDLLRNGVVIGTARGVTDGDGFAEVNHPGGFCWTGWTPDMRPGDTVRVAKLTGPAGSEVLELDSGGQPIGGATTVANVQAEPAQKVGSTLVVHGTAATMAGAPLSPAEFANLEQRIIEPALVSTAIGKRDIRAPGGGTGYSSTLSYDPVGVGNPTGTEWTAVYSGPALTDSTLQIAEGGQSRILSWQAVVGPDRVGITIFEAGELGGPGFGGCPPAAPNAVTSPSSLNAAALADPAAPIVFSGSAQPTASAVSLTLSDADGGPTVTVPGTMGAGTWTASVPAGDITTAFPGDGPLTADATYTVGGSPVGGTALTVTKDTTAPGAPAGSPPPGTYPAAQSVQLTSDDPTATIHYTTNGTAPTASSPVASGNVPVTSSLTIRAIAIDPVGNAGPASTLDYVISPPAAQTVVVERTVPLAGAPAGPAALAGPVAPLAQRAPSERLTLGGLFARRVLRLADARRGIKVTALVPAGSQVLRVRLIRVSGGKRRVVLSVVRQVGEGSTLRVTLTGKKLRSLRPGAYVIEATPGLRRRSLGDESTRRLRVIR